MLQTYSDPETSESIIYRNTSSSIVDTGEQRQIASTKKLLFLMKPKVVMYIHFTYFSFNF